MSSISDPEVPEIAWFGALCDDDYEFLGVPDPALASSWAALPRHRQDRRPARVRQRAAPVGIRAGHRLDGVRRGHRHAHRAASTCCSPCAWARCGCPSSPASWRRSTRCRRPADDQHHLLGHPRRGAARRRPRYQRTREWMAGAAHAAQRRARSTSDGEFVAPARSTRRGHDRVAGALPADVLRRLLRRRQGRRRRRGRRVPHVAGHRGLGRPPPSRRCGSGRRRTGGDAGYGLRAHVIVRETEADGQGRRRSGWCRKLDDDTGAEIRSRSRSMPHRSASSARPRSARPRPTTGSSRRRCGPASGGPAAAPVRRSSAIRTRCWPSSAPTRAPASRRSSCPATPTEPSAELFARHVLPRLDHTPLR